MVQFKSGDTEVDFRNTVWATVISKEADRKSGMPDKRRTTLSILQNNEQKNVVWY
ncbi:hypothetical protein [Vibrio taketomensis]|uniref:hypothetical protein n=1 Tax=Vibrio taketomensis TaxID=2572923 RepID=UPI001583E0D6|nr:hypothetical protein [Vibrio taketomensis]